MQRSNSNTSTVGKKDFLINVIASGFQRTDQNRKNRKSSVASEDMKSKALNLTLK